MKPSEKLTSLQQDLIQSENEKGLMGKGWLAQVDMERTQSTHAQPAMPTGQGAWEKPPEQQPPVLNSPDCANVGHKFSSALASFQTLCTVYSSQKHPP